MTFPVLIEHPIFDLVLPATEKKIKFRPFLVKERKILQMALETNNDADITTATKQILKNCCVTDIDIDNLPVIDVEYFSLNLIAKSKGEIVTPKFRCENVINGNMCRNIIEIPINITEIPVENLKKQKDRKIFLSSTMGIAFNYPSFKLSKNDNILDIIISCIDYVFDDENIYHAKDYSKEDLDYFLDSLTNEHIEKIEKFFEELPILSKEYKQECSKCGFQHSIKMKGYSSFFL